VDANDRDAEDVPLMHWSAINGREPICRYLLSRGADPGASGGVLNETALQWAARQGHVEVVMLLLTAGTNPLHLNIYGQNGLHLAAQMGHTAVALLLLAHGVSPVAPDDKGFMPLM
ncbi:unnamed protein product, partial [Phaeothamnion confervicola]